MPAQSLLPAQAGAGIQSVASATRTGSANLTREQSGVNDVKTVWIPQAVASLMLLWALNPQNPYGYYILLRWVCCAAFAYLAWQAAEREKQGWVWVLAVTALVYNPIIRLHLGREIWSLVNVATIAVSIMSIWAFRAEKND